MTGDSCRLCGGAVHSLFQCTVLSRHAVDFRVCQDCGSLQTEKPYWLAEAYASNLSSLDTGAVQRNLTNLAAVLSVAAILRVQDILDFGGGDGLLCRLLRDHRLNCYVQDKHAAPTYAPDYALPDFSIPGMLTAFEVVEHFEEPASDLRQIFDRKADSVLLSTETFNGQGKSWWYLSPETGQHVFFYSPQALHLIARRFGYRLVLRGKYALFLREGRFGRMQTVLCGLVLNRVLLRILRAAIQMLPTPGVARDFELAQRRRMVR